MRYHCARDGSYAFKRNVLKIDRSSLKIQSKCYYGICLLALEFVKLQIAGWNMLA